jgi:hypothetical protein
MCVKKLLICLMVAFAVSTLGGSAWAIEEINGENSTYLFNKDAHTVDAPVPYILERTLSAADFGADKFIEMNDMTVADDGSVYISDGKAGAVYKLSADTGNTKLSAFLDGDREIRLEEPSGVFISAAQELYVADRKTGYIYTFDLNFGYKRKLAPPAKEEYFSEQPYEPIKLCVDTGGRIYVISANQSQGILQFTAEGKFSGFLGSDRVQPSAADLFWRTFGTQKQKDQLQRLIPTEYNNLDVDADSFVYGTISIIKPDALENAVKNGAATPTPIRRLNPKGEDVLLRQGVFVPVGDVNFYLKKRGNPEPSTIVDVTSQPFGVYSLLDRLRGRVFTYDKTGNLLFEFGDIGEKTDEFAVPVALCSIDGKMFIADSGKGNVKVFTPSDYAGKLYDAIRLHEEGLFEAETEAWKVIRREFGASQLAFAGLGKAAMSDRDYISAMEYFKTSNDKENYSKAFKLYRKDVGYQNIAWIFLGIFILIVAAFVLKRLLSKRLAYEGEPSTLGQRVRYARQIVFHPFKSYWDLKVRGIGTVSSATVILVMTVTLSLLQTLLTPWLFASGDGQNILLQNFFGIVILLALFVAANWCFTTLMDGKGTVKDIYIYACYALTPLLVSIPIQIILSRFLSLDELLLYGFAGNAAMFIVGLLLFIGTLVVHDYTPGKTVLMLLLIVVGMMLIVFVLLLSITLIQQILLYIMDCYEELRLR